MDGWHCATAGIHTGRSAGLHTSARCGIPTCSFCSQQDVRLYLPAQVSRLPAAHGSRTSFHAGNRRGLQGNGLHTGSSGLPCSAWKYAGRNAGTPVPGGRAAPHLPIWHSSRLLPASFPKQCRQFFCHGVFNHNYGQSFQVFFPLSLSPFRFPAGNGFRIFPRSFCGNSF